MKNKAKKILLVLALALIAFDLSTIVQSLNHSSTVKVDNKLGSLVRLVMKGSTFCSGTVISAHTVLTAAHCVIIESPFGPALLRPGIEIRASDNVDLGLDATVYSVRIQLDQALLEGDFRQFRARKFITDVEDLTSPNTLKQKFTACGYPMGGPIYCTTIFYKELDNFMWKMNGVLIPGMSGGYVIDPDGNVVAVNSAVEGNSSLVSPIYNLNIK